jgi:hypothetical protein
MTIKHLFPPAWPTLDLNFAATRELDPRITFTRSSIGTYVDANGIVQTAAADEPRFDHDPATRKSLGLLLEESRTNVVEYSEDFNATGWNSAALNLSNAPTIIAPDGSNNATLMVPTNSGNYVEVTYNTGLTGVRTCSVFAKAEGKNYINIGARMNGGSAALNIQFDLTTGEQTTSSTLVTGYSQQFKNGWWKVTAVVDSTNPNFMVGSADQGGVVTTADGTGIYIFGAMAENASFSTSYIATSGSTVTRSADVASVETSPWYNANVGSFYVEAGVPSNDTLRYLYGGRDDNFNVNSISVNLDPVDRHVTRLYDSTGVQKVFSTNSTPPAQSGFISSKHAVAYSSGDSNTALDGSIIATTINDAFTRSGPSSIYLGDLSNGKYLINGHISRFAYYPRRLTDEQLKALTS